MAKRNRSKDEFYSFFSRKSDSAHEPRHMFRPKKQPVVPRILAFVFVILLGVSAWYGFGFFSPRVHQAHDALSLDIVGPASITEGVPVDYQVVVKNTGDTDFSHGDLFLEYQSTFAVLETDPQAQNNKKNFWNMGTLAKGSTTTIHLHGLITGSGTQENSVNASLQYENSLYHSSFVVKKSFISHIEPAKQDLISIEGPQSIRPGDHVSYGVRYQDIRALPHADSIHLKIDIPQNIHIDQKKPEATDIKNNDWNSKVLQGAVQQDAQTGSLTLDGTADQVLLDTQSIVDRLFFTNPDGTDTLLSEKKYDITPAHGDITLSLHIDDIPNGPIQFGGAIPCAVMFENNGPHTLKNTTVSLTTESPLIQWSDSDSGNAKKDTASFTWTADSQKELASIAPHAKGMLRFCLVLKDPSMLTDVMLHPSAGALGVSIQLQATSESVVDPQGNPVKDGLITQISPITIPVLSDARLSAFVRLIPSPGNNSSIVRVNLALTNSLHDLSDIQINARIGAVGEWTSTSTRSAGDISYSADQKEVAWSLNKMPLSVHRIDASFDLSVPQGFTDTSAIIIKDVSFKAKDASLNAPLARSIANLTLLKGTN